MKTKEYLEKQGVQVRLFNQWTDRFKEGDILHVFGSVKEALGLMEVAKTQGVKIVHSPIIWYNWQSSLQIPYRPKERLLGVVRQIAKVLCPAIPSDRKRMMELADIVLAGSEMEADQIHRYFLISRNKIRVITYGVENRFREAKPDFFENKHKLKNFVLMVGRIEPRKNQLSLIRALNQQPCELVVVGGAVSNHRNYYEQCRKEAANNIHFTGPLDQDSEELRSAFAACDVFALPSWFETPGLAALEAGLSGAKVVITREGSTREYFGEYADYVNPASIGSIRNTVLRALKRQKTEHLRNHIRQKFLWEKAAERHVQLYESQGFKN